MNRPTYSLFIPGINDNDWQQRAAAYVASLGGNAGWTDYIGSFGANLFVEWRNRALVETVRSLARTYRLDIYAHSHGCKRAMLAVNALPGGYQVENIHLIAAACPEDAGKNGMNCALFWGRAHHITCYCSNKDGALKLANWRLSRWLGFDDLGRVGPTGLIPAYANAVTVVRRDEFNHSDWLHGENMKNLIGGTL